MKDLNTLKPYLMDGRLEAGCDEAGRGCLAGPVYAAAVILPDSHQIPGLHDSKKLSANQRDELRVQIENNALAWSVAWMEPTQIDKLNILQAAIKAMHKAVASLSVKPDHLLIDGSYFRPYKGISHNCIVKGDAKYQSIAAASILAKTHRDERMQALHKQYPDYGWQTNQGYPTVAHREAIRIHGACAHHRKSFRLLPEVEVAAQMSLFSNLSDL